jgi:hypothetical protein
MPEPTQVVLINSARTTKPKRLHYIWKKRIARGKITVIGGDPGVGKGLLGIEITAVLTTARTWPDGGEAPLCRVALLTGEDDESDTIVPRLDVAGADRDRVDFIKSVGPVGGQARRVSLDQDAELLIRTVRERGADVLIIDPLSSYLGENTNSWRDSDVRRVLDPIAEAAARYSVAVILVAHLTKGGGTHAIYRFQGSLATVAAARFGLLVAPHPHDANLRVFASMKANLAALPSSLTFRIAISRHPELEDDEIARIEWVGSTTLTANELLEKAEKKGSALDRAEQFLVEYLSPGEAASEEVKTAASRAGIGVKHALWEAKESLGVKARKNGTGAWLWSLPPESLLPSSDRDASVQAKASQSERDASRRFSSNQAISLRYLDPVEVVQSNQIVGAEIDAEEAAMAEELS